MHYKQFEDLPVWQEARQFVDEKYRLIESNKKLKSNFSLSDQLRRAAISILLNIAEGFERGSNKEFANFLNISKGSAGEVRSVLYILLDNGYTTTEIFSEYKNKALEISSHLSNFRKYLLNNSGYKK